MYTFGLGKGKYFVKMYEALYCQRVETNEEQTRKMVYLCKSWQTIDIYGLVPAKVNRQPNDRGVPRYKNKDKKNKM